VLVFHATGIGGRAMENLGDSRLPWSAFIDLTTTPKVADMIVGGVFPGGQRTGWGAADPGTGLPLYRLGSGRWTW